ncbi:MAG: hypothetical protein Q8L47_01310 [bacterium]|nr:hypothetical protein [bacterium]
MISCYQQINPQMKGGLNLVPGQKRRFRKGWSERFDPRRYRKVFLNGTYPGGQRKLLGSHGGKSYCADWTESRKRKIIDTLLEKETEEMSLLDYYFDELSDYFENEWDEDEEGDEKLDNHNHDDNDDLDYDALDYSDVF